MGSASIAIKRLQAERDFKNDLGEFLERHTSGMAALGCSVGDWKKLIRENRLTGIYILIAGDDPWQQGFVAASPEPAYPQGLLSGKLTIPPEAEETINALRELCKKHEWLLNEIFMDVGNQVVLPLRL